MAALCGAVATLMVATTVPAAAENRTLDLYYTHTRERLTITYKKDGRFIPSALKQLNHFLRDWRRNEPTNMDPRLFDTVWEIYRQSGSRQPIHIVSAYRSLPTNNMLRSRSKAVAKHSQHTLGKAMDFFLPDVSINKLRAIGMKMQRGGVGWYPRSNSPFVHIDVGNVRSWPRMTRTQLSQLFPDGKTVHLPADGKPLAGYQQALSELRRNGSTTSAVAMADEKSGAKKGGGLLAMLFGDDEDESVEEAAATQGPAIAAEEEPAPVRTRKVTPPPAPEPQPVVLARAAVPAEAPAPASLAEATIPAVPKPVIVAEATPPPLPRGKPQELKALAQMQLAMLEAPVVPPLKPVLEIAPPPAAVVAEAPAVRPTLPAIQPLADEPANAQLALAEVAAAAPDATPPTTLSYAAPDSLAALPALPDAQPTAPARRSVPKIVQASLGASILGVAPAPASTPDAKTGRADPAVALPPAREDQLATLTTFLPPVDLPVYDPYQGMAGRSFAVLIHPDQRRDGMMFAAPVAVLQAGFQPAASGDLSYSRFQGDAVIRIATVRFAGRQDLALR
ncbi:DUF882 domain-containing protein [Chthonobacter albigriseus]|uniref:DUF882 domain-containing protein n=1 Tax=Chthonobacter albigriseus TaxID=1683161 RepID=UPI0015EF1640